MLWSSPNSSRRRLVQPQAASQSAGQSKCHHGLCCTTSPHWLLAGCTGWVGGRTPTNRGAPANGLARDCTTHNASTSDSPPVAEALYDAVQLLGLLHAAQRRLLSGGGTVRETATEAQRHTGG
jgi:hypothetical protein